MDKVDHPTTRRALLAAAAGGAAALAAQTVVPLTASADTGNPVLLGTANTADQTTGINTAANAVDAFAATAGGASGSAVVAMSAAEAGTFSVSGNPTGAATRPQTKLTGVYGYTPASADPNVTGTGVWGDSDDTGVIGTGGYQGVLGDGFIGVEGDGSGNDAIGVLGFAGSPKSTGVVAQADATDRTALKVQGKVLFSRSGRASIATGKASKVVSFPGVTTGSLVFAVLSTNRAGRWVRAVVPAAGKFTVYLNASVPAATSVVWWIIN